MKFSEIYYCEYQDIVENDVIGYPHIKGNKGKGGGIVLYYLNVVGYYKVENNELIIDDDYLEKIKFAVRKKRVKVKDYDLSEFKEEYIIDLGGNYLILTQAEDRNPEDIKLTPDEFMIKRLLE